MTTYAKNRMLGKYGQHLSFLGGREVQGEWSRSNRNESLRIFTSVSNDGIKALCVNLYMHIARVVSAP